MTIPQPFQYQGSKRALAPLILQYLPLSTTRLVEPFCGSAALSIAAAARGRAGEFWLNDLNVPLAKLLSLIVNNPKELGKSYRELWRGDDIRLSDVLSDAHTGSMLLIFVVASRSEPYVERKNFRIEGAPGKIIDRGSGVDLVRIVENSDSRERLRLGAYAKSRRQQ